MPSNRTSGREFPQLALFYAEQRLRTLGCPDDSARGPVEFRDVDGDTEEEPASVIVFESRSHRSADGNETPVSIVGEVTQDILDQVARPWSYPDEPYVYQEEAWEHTLEGGLVEVGYRITRMVREAPDDVLRETAVRVDPLLVEHVEAAVNGTRLPVHIRLRDFPEWDVPPSPHGLILAPEDIEFATSRREDAIAARQHLAEEMSSEIVGAITQAEGEVVGIHGSSGWIWARIPADRILAFAERDDIDELHWPDREVQATAWRQGDGRWSTRMNADVFLSSGYDASITNANRHAWPSLMASVIEATGPGTPVSGFEDEACAFYQGANCTGSTRIVARYQCDLGGSTPCGLSQDSQRQRREIMELQLPPSFWVTIPTIRAADSI